MHYRVSSWLFSLLRVSWSKDCSHSCGDRSCLTCSILPISMQTWLISMSFFRSTSQCVVCHACAQLQAGDQSEEDLCMAAASAAVLYPCQFASAPAAAATQTAEIDLSEQSASVTDNMPDPEPTWQTCDASITPNFFFNTRALQLWILRACQQLKGGLRDKPGKSADYYHSCYCLSGLSVLQHMPGGGLIGSERNGVKQADPVVNIVCDKLQRAREYFQRI